MSTGPQSEVRRPQHAIGMVGLLLLVVAAGLARAHSSRPHRDSPLKQSGGALLDGYRHVEVASVYDALEQLTGKKMYMTHRMRPIFPGNSRALR
jgi:hypothetical protein